MLKGIRDFLNYASEVSTGLLIVDPLDGRILYGNREAAEIFGFSASEDLKGQKLDELCCSPPSEVLEAMRRIRYGEAVYLKIDHVVDCRSTMKKIPVSCTLMSMRYDDRPVAFIIVVDRSREVNYIRLYDALSSITRIFWDKPYITEKEWLTQVACILHEEVGFPAVVIGRVEAVDNHFIPIIVKAVKPEVSKLFKFLTIELKDKEEGLLCPAYFKKQAVVVEDIINDPAHMEWKELHERFGAAGGAAIPIVVDGKVDYILVLYDTTKDAFNKSLIPFYKDLHLILSLMLKSIRTFYEKEHIKELYNLLYNLLSVSLRTEAESQLLDRLPEMLYRHLNATMVALFIIEDERLKYRKVMAPDMEHVELMKRITSLLERYTLETLPELLNVTKAVRERRLFFRSTLETAEALISAGTSPETEEFIKCNTLLLSYGIKSCGALPVLKGGNPIGAILFFSKERGFFTSKVQELLNILVKEIDFILTNIEANKLNRLLLKALDSGFDLVTILDSDFRFVYANRPALERSGYKLEEILGKHHSIFSSKIYDKHFARRFYETLTSGKVFSDYMVYRLKDGSLAQGYMIIIPYKEGGKITHYICIGKEVTRDERFIEETLRFLFYDAVTGLPNMRRFAQELENSLRELSLRGEGSGAILVIIDPMDFELINQVYGFETGNLILKRIGERLRASLYKNDILGRMESDAFSVFIKDIPRLETGIFVIERLLNVLDEPFTDVKSLGPIHITFRAGAAVYPTDGREPQALMDAARAALMEAKRRNERLVFYSEDLTQRARLAVLLNNEIKEGIERREFTFFYQPIVNAKGEIKGAECLLRWIKGKRLIKPGEFLPVIRQIYTQIQLEEFLANLFVSKVREFLPVLSRRSMYLSFNVSPEAFRKSQIAEYFLRELRVNPRVGAFMSIEFIERSFLEAEEKVMNFVYASRKCGVKIAIDDFGTGYSPLSYLVDLPVDILKLDSSLTRGILSNERTYSIVEALVHFCRRAGIVTVAEGVEEVNQFEALKRMGCDLFQGYLFYEPMEEEDFIRMLMPQ